MAEENVASDSATVKGIDKSDDTAVGMMLLMMLCSDLALCLVLRKLENSRFEECLAVKINLFPRWGLRLIANSGMIMLSRWQSDDVM